MRRILLAALLMLIAVPASASAGELVDTCGGTSSPLYGPCRLGESAASNVSAACRRTADERVDDSTCWTPISPRTSRRMVREYRSSWLHRTLDFQYDLAGDVPFANAPWIGTHNSFNSASEGFTLSGADHNQQLSLANQLDIDVRSLELDVHWFWRNADASKAPVVCHARPAEEQHAGCTNERLFDARLAEIRDWLAAHPQQVVLLYVEDHLENADGYAAAAQMLDSVLGDRIYKPSGGGCPKLPLTGLTRDDVLAAGSQVVVMSGCDASGGAWNSLVFDDSIRNEARPQDLGTGCGFARETYDAGFVRFFEDSTVVAANGQYVGAAETDDGLTPDTTRQLVRCGLDLSGFDQLLPDDGRLDAWAWSWEEGEPRSSDDCAVQVKGGRWQGTACAGAHRFACRAADGTWSVTRKPAPFKQGADRCGDTGGTFATPRTARENELLRRAADGATTWVAVRRSGSGWLAVD